jgi:hypothetical protein
MATVTAMHHCHRSLSLHRCHCCVSHPCAPPPPRHHHLILSTPSCTPPFPTHHGHHCWLIVVCSMGVRSKCNDFVISCAPQPPAPPPPSSSSPFTYLALLLVVFVVATFTPCYGWLLCVGRTGSDMVGVIIASRIIIVVIIVSPPSPAEERMTETCEGGRGHGGDCLGVNTAPLPCCGRACKASERMFSWSSLSTTSLKTVFFCKNGHSYKKNKNWRS